MERPAAGFIPDDCHPSVGAIVDYWCSIHPPQGLPGRQHFDPVDVPKLLSNIGLIDVQNSPRRFRIRLYGTALVSVMGEDYTGKWYDELFENFEKTGQYTDFCHVVDTHSPHWRRGALRIPTDRDFHFLERVHLPLASDGKNVDMILTFAVFFDGDDPFLKARGVPTSET